MERVAGNGGAKKRRLTPGLVFLWFFADRQDIPVVQYNAAAFGDHPLKYWCVDLGPDRRESAVSTI